MRSGLHILLFNLLFLSACFAQGDKESKVFTASINDSTAVDVYLGYDDHGDPDAYYCRVNTAVCEEGLCKLMVIDVYWDLLGNFLRYELPDGEALTKLDHQEFTTEDHEKLCHILSDKGSILRDYPADDLIDRQMLTTATDNKVDAVTSATRADIKDAVVSGAVFSTYVLWHIVNGPIASAIARHSKPFLTTERVRKMFYSQNFYYQYYALSSIGPEDSVAYLNEVVHLVKHGASYIPYFAIEKVPASAWRAHAPQRSLLEYFGTADFELQNFILNRIESVSLSPEGLELLISAMRDLRDSQITKALDVVRKNAGVLNARCREQLARLSDHPNKEIAGAVGRILAQRKG